MKKYFEIIVSVFVLAIGLSLPAAAQDATYSCGAYGAGSYSNNDCVDDTENGDSSGASGGSQSDDAGGAVSGGGSDTGDENDKTPGESDEGKPVEEEDSNIFSVFFAKLATSWGWLVFFGLLVVVGMVIIGLVRRKRDVR